MGESPLGAKLRFTTFYVEYILQTWYNQSGLFHVDKKRGRKHDAGTLFDIIYLLTVITLGILMIRASKGRKQYSLYGAMAVILGCGDAFHLVPRAIALCTTGLETYTVPLGIGKMVTSITMTLFYVLLYYVWRCRYQIKDKKRTYNYCMDLIDSPYFLMSYATECMDQRRSTSFMGNLSQYSFCDSWCFDCYFVLYNFEKRAG